MSMLQKKISTAIVAIVLASGVSLAQAQTAPPTGSTPPPTGSTPPPTGSTPPPTGSTTGACYIGTTPPPNSTMPPCTNGELPPTGTTQPPTGSTSTACYLPTPGVPIPAGAKVCEFTIPSAGSATTDPSSFFKSVSLDQLAGMNADQIKSFSPTAASGFSATQLGALKPEALAGMNADLLKNLDPSALSGLKDTQIQSLLPDALKGLSVDQLKNLAPSAMDGFTSQQVAGMLPTQLSALSPQQFAGMDPGAISGVTAEQFKSLPTSLLNTMDTSKLAALDVNVIKTMEKESLAALDPQAVKNMAPKELAEMMVNLDKQKLAPADVKSLLPTGWAIDDKTGKLQPPAGAEVTLKTAATTTLPAGVTLPKLPDLNTGLALGGDSSGGSVIDGMEKALQNAGLPGFDILQTNGVLNVVGTGAKSGTNLAFIPDSSKIVQAAAGTPSGLSKNAQGAYVLTTPEGTQVPVIPALASPENLVKAAPGTKIEVKDSGSTTITPAGATTPVVGIPDPVVQKSSLAPGVHTSGTGATKTVTVVYQDGTAQALKPTIQDVSEFKEATKAFPQIKDVTVGTDGIIKINYNGQTLQLKPDFDLKSGSGAAGKPTITPVANGVFRFTNSKGESQDIYLGV